MGTAAKCKESVGRGAGDGSALIQQAGKGGAGLGAAEEYVPGADIGNGRRLADNRGDRCERVNRPDDAGGQWLVNSRSSFSYNIERVCAISKSFQGYGNRRVEIRAIRSCIKPVL